MSRIHGRNGIVYIGANNGDAGEPDHVYLSDWTTELHDDQHLPTLPRWATRTLSGPAGLPDSSGDFTGVLRHRFRTDLPGGAGRTSP